MSSSVQTDMNIEVVSIKKAALVFRAINHNLRRHMVQLLHQNARMTVTQLYVKLRLEQSVASQHLAILRKAGLVSTERQGKFIFYSVNYGRLKQIQELAGNLLK
jgi:DNA-binding transcriptional ArsR family regulator